MVIPFLLLVASQAASVQAPSAATCTAAYSLEIARRHGRGPLGKETTPALGDDALMRQAALWSAVGTRDTAAIAATAAEVRRLKTQASAAQETFRQCSGIDAVSRLPALPPPPAPVRPPNSGCVFSVAQVRAERRACVAQVEIVSVARAAQQQLEHGGLSCRSVADAQQAWVDLGLAASAAGGRDPGCPH